MAASARLVVLMSPKEKAALEAKVARVGRIPAGELVRRAVASYEVTAVDDAADLRSLLDVLGPHTPRDPAPAGGD